MVKRERVTHQGCAFAGLLSVGQRGDEEEDRAGDEQAGDQKHGEREQRLVHGLASPQPVARHAAYPGALLRGPLDVYLRMQRELSFNAEGRVARFSAKLLLMLTS